MSYYNYQYKRYYQELQNKNLARNTSPIYKRNLVNDVNSSEIKRRYKKSFFTSIVNVFIYQLVVVVFMLMVVFYLKYSPNENESYKSIKAAINNKNYSIYYENNKSFNISEILSKINKYIKESLDGGKVDF